MSSQEDLRLIALAEFASAGYAATSLQRLAELAGLSKSSVLYHFDSKEAVLEAAIDPALIRMDEILAERERGQLDDAGRRAFLEQFVDLLLDHRLEVHLFINQGPSLVDVPVIDRANALVERIAAYFAANAASPVDKMRFGIALGGAAYMLCTAQSLGLSVGTREETRVALLTIMGELLAPVHIR